MKRVFGHYKGWTLFIIPNWYRGKSTFFVVAPGADPKLLFGERLTHDDAVVAGRKVIRHEADK